MSISPLKRRSVLRSAVSVCLLLVVPALLNGCGGGSGGSSNSSPAPSIVAFIRSNTLYTVRPDGTNLRAIPTSGTGLVRLPSVSPDRKKILFVKEDFVVSGSPNGRVVIINADGSHERIIESDVHNDYLRGVSFSLDGKYVVISRTHYTTQNTGPSSVSVLKLDGTEVARYNGGLIYPHLSLDGRTLYAPGSLYGIQRVNLSTGKSSYFARVDTTDVDYINLSPDGQRFVLTRNGRLEIRSIDGSSPVTLSTVTGDVREPAWSPDGTSIVIDTNFGSTDGSNGLSIVSTDGTQIKRLTQGSNDYQPSWN